MCVKHERDCCRKNTYPLDRAAIKKGTSREGAFGGKRMLLSGFAFGVCDASLDGFHRGLGLDFGSLGFDHAIVLGVG